MKFGIVVHNLQGGDMAIHFVDEDRWNQIRDFWNESEGYNDFEWERVVRQTVEWLTLEDPLNKRPPGVPDRVGQTLRTVFTQKFIYEDVLGIQGELLGLLTIE